MNITMRSIQINDKMYLQFIGDEYQLSELKEYMESK